MKNILITGAYGFVGKNLAKDLAKNNEYYTIALDIIEENHTFYNSYYSWENINNIKWDLVDTIIHLAGKAHDTKNSTDPKTYYDINYGLTKVVFDKYLHSNVKTFIYFSSVKAVADTLEGKVLTEEFSPNPKTPYGLSKLQSEYYILNHNVTPEKKVYILRPCMIHGPGNKGNLNLLYNFIKKGIPYPLGEYNNLRSFSSIENIIYIIRNLIEKSVNQGIYNVCDDEPISTNELIQMIAKSCNQSPRLMKIPVKLIETIAAFGDVLHIPFNSERLKKLTESYVVSNKKLKSALGIKNLPINTREGFQNTFNSFTKK